MVRIKPFPHGVINRYWQGCRCKNCRRAMTAYQKNLRIIRAPLLAADDPRHGSYTTYNNHGCRCSECRAAMAVKRRETYHKAKENA